MIDIGSIWQSDVQGTTDLIYYYIYLALEEGARQERAVKHLQFIGSPSGYQAHHFLCLPHAECACMLQVISYHPFMPP